MAPSVFAVAIPVLIVIPTVSIMVPSVFTMLPSMCVVVWCVDIVHRSVMVWCIWVDNSTMWLGCSWLLCLLWLLWLLLWLFWCVLSRFISMVLSWVSISAMSGVAIVWKSSVWDSIGHFLSQEDLGKGKTN